MVGLSFADFAPSCRHVISITGLRERLSIWSLVDKSVSHIPSPKLLSKGVKFSNDGLLMALIER